MMNNWAWQAQFLRELHWHPENRAAFGWNKPNLIKSSV